METTTCSKCNTVKVLSEFARKTRSKNGTSSWCKMCYRAYNRAYHKTPKRKAYNARYAKKLREAGYFREYNQRPEVKKRQAAHMKRYRNDPQKRIKHIARWYFNHRKASGKIQREPCAICGKQQAEGHHLDYTKPLLIVWLCTACHRDEHAKLKDNAKPKAEKEAK